ncbi:MAG: hypothetical protein NNA20_06325 [Nitrospira sp.]|nr:hypothetical protein [Nitrospira sp.]MCP9442191.1 hypothetical protein [Nitrospira sp.]
MENDVTALEITHPIPFHLKEGTILNGTAVVGPNRTINIQADPIQGSMWLSIEQPRTYV